MRKTAIAAGIAALMLLVGGVVWQADASVFKSGTVNLPEVAKNYSPIEKAGCARPGRWCPAGWVLRCGPWRCRCVRC